MLEIYRAEKDIFNQDDHEEDGVGEDDDSHIIK